MPSLRLFEIDKQWKFFASRRNTALAISSGLLNLVLRPTTVFGEQSIRHANAPLERSGPVERSGPELAAEADPRRLLPHEHPPWDSYVLSSATFCEEFTVVERLQGYTVLRRRAFYRSQPAKIDISHVAKSAFGLVLLAAWDNADLWGTRVYAAQGDFAPLNENSWFETLEETVTKVIRSDYSEKSFVSAYSATSYRAGKQASSHSALPWAKGPFSIIYTRSAELPHRDNPTGGMSERQQIYSHAMRWVIGDDNPDMRVEGLSVDGKPFGKTFDSILKAAVSERK